MQFAGQRTDLCMKPIGEPVNMLIKLTDDTLPEPDAIMITGITPQQTKADGYTEAEFLKVFWEEVATPDTIFVGFNSVRFDDEFMRFLQYRNFYDAYAWQWQDGRGRWDILDVVRMTRALRPDGIEWPFDSEGRPANRLESLTKVNKLDHQNAHDALSDVLATIAVARLIYNKQQKLFEYLLSMRSKQKVAELVESNEPFVYSSGKYSSEFEKTTVAVRVTDSPGKQGSLVYDLRFDPDEYTNKTPEELVELWRWKKDRTEPRLPVKTLQYNRCPAVAPMGVLDDSSRERLKIDLDTIQTNLKKLLAVVLKLSWCCKRFFRQLIYNNKRLVGLASEYIISISTKVEHKLSQLLVWHNFMIDTNGWVAFVRLWNTASWSTRTSHFCSSLLLICKLTVPEF